MKINIFDMEMESGAPHWLSPSASKEFRDMVDEALAKLLAKPLKITFDDEDDEPEDDEPEDAAEDADFDEKDHPRAKGGETAGQFVKKGTGGGGATERPRITRPGGEPAPSAPEDHPLLADNLFLKVTRPYLKDEGFEHTGTEEKAGIERYEYQDPDSNHAISVALLEDGWTLYDWRSGDSHEGFGRLSLRKAIDTVKREAKEADETKKKREAKGQAIAKPPRAPDSGGLNRKRIEAAKAEVEMLVAPMNAYRKVLQKADDAFNDHEMSLHVDHGPAPSSHDQYSLTKLGTNTPVDPDTLEPKLKSVWNELKTVNVKAHERLYEAGQQSSSTWAHDEVKRVADIVTKALGYDPDKLEVSDEDKEFTLRGNTYKYAGAATIHGPDKGKIVVYAQHATPSFLPGLTAHETMHQKWQAIFDEYVAEKEKMGKVARESGPDFEGTVNPDGTVRDELKDEYPVYAALYPVLQKDDLYKKLRKSDGVTDYSKEHWKAFEEGSGDVETAYHETLAEISYLHWNTGEVQAAPVWRKLYHTVNKLYGERDKRKLTELPKWRSIGESLEPAKDAAPGWSSPPFAHEGDR